MSEPTPPDLRASDAERDQVAELLRDGATDGRLSVEELEQRLQQAYVARTRGELERLVADLGGDPIAGEDAVAGTRRRDGVALREGPGGAAWIVSMMGGNDRRGRWRISPTCTVLNVMGGSDLDLCDVELAGPVTQLNVYSVMGGSDIRVPDGVHVEVSKFALMGGHDVRLSAEAPPPGAPLIRIRLVSIMGGGSVRRGRRPTRAKRRRARQTTSERRGELDA